MVDPMTLDIYDWQQRPTWIPKIIDRPWEFWDKHGANIPGLFGHVPVALSPAMREQALSHAVLAAQLFPDDPRVHRTLGIMRWRTGDLAGARDSLGMSERLGQSFLKDRNGLEVRAWVALDAGDMSAAHKTADRLRRLVEAGYSNSKWVKWLEQLEHEIE